MGYPMTYTRVVSRNNLLGDYRPAVAGRGDALGLIAGDLRRLEKDARDEAHIKAIAKATGATRKQVKAVLDHFFEGQGLYIFPRDPWNVNGKGFPVSHLWEAKHDYYCNRGNYYAPGREQPVGEYRTWAAFLAAEGDSDFDMNFVFRFDWIEGEDYDLPPFNGDANYRGGKLLVFWMGQRKGLYRWSEIEVCRADEPAIIEWLKPRLAHLLAQWAPLSPEIKNEEY